MHKGHTFTELKPDIFFVKSRYMKPDLYHEHSIENNVDPDQLASEPADQGPHCFQYSMYLHNNQSNHGNGLHENQTAAYLFI